MNPWPPHSFRRSAEAIGRAPEIIRRALLQAQVVQRRGLPALLTLNHLATETRVPFDVLRSVVNRTHDEPYRCFAIRKRLGGHRTICVPHPALMRVQRWVARYILSAVAPHPASYAYAPRRSALACARLHCSCRWLVKVDVRQFFESISERQVYQIFHGLGYQPLISFELARLCTRVIQQPTYRYARRRWLNRPDVQYFIREYNSRRVGHLPQGAPTSPMLSNLVARPLDERLSTLAAERNLVYTRYADDLVFSTDHRNFTREEAARLIRDVYAHLRESALRPRTAKTVVSPPGARKVVLGLLVDSEEPRLSRELRERLELHVYHLQRHGPAAHAARRGFRSLAGMREHIRGLLNYAAQVDGEFALPLLRAFETIEWPT